MALVLEDGTGLANANSYASEATLGTYADDRGLTLASGDAEAALIRASQWLDSTYRSRFQGYRVRERAQALEWPRFSVYDASGFLVDSDSVPVEIVSATCEAAIRELTEAGSLAPDLDRGGQIKELGAGSVRIVYGDNAPTSTTYTAINGAAYAMRIEFGFVGVDSLGRHYNQAPRSFVRTTLDRAEAIANETALKVSAQQQ